MKPRLKKVFIALCLLALWFILTMWYVLIIDSSFLVYSFPHDNSAIKNFSQKPLLKGEKFEGEIVSIEKGLGIISLRFKSSKRIPYKDEDVIVFRVKEKGSSQWYHESTYKSGLIYDVPFLPFGFPVIQDSKGKTYQFELESLKGNVKNGVVLDTRAPIVISKYKQNKAQVLSNLSSFSEFIIKKFFNSIKIVDVYFSSIVFLLPFIFHVLWSIGYIKLNNKNKESFYAYINNFLSRIDNTFSTYPFILISIPLILICIDVLFLQVLNDLLYIVISVLWIVIFKRYKLVYKYTMFLAISLLFIAALLELGNILAAEKAATWSFTFLVILFIQIVLEEKVT